MKTEISSYDQQAIDFLQATQTEFKAEYLRFDSMPFDTDGTKRNIFKITLANLKHSYSFEFGDSVANSCRETKRPKIESNEPTEIYFGFKHNTFKDSVIFSHTIKTSYPVLRTIEDPYSLIDPDQLAKDFAQYQDQIREYNSKKYNVGHGIEGIRGSDFNDIAARIRKRIDDFIREARTETDTLTDQQSETIVPPTPYAVLACLTKSDPGDFENFCSDYGYDTDSRKAVRTYKAVRKEWTNLCKLFSDSEIEALQEIN